MAWGATTALNTLFYSSTADDVPTNLDNLVNGSVAVNTADGKTWIKIQGGTAPGGWELVGSSVPGAAGAITSVTATTVGVDGSGASQNATVVNNGTTSAAELSFGLPTGSTGQNGQTGQTGQTGASGDITSNNAITSNRGLYGYATGTIAVAGYKVSALQIGYAYTTVNTDSPYIIAKTMRSHGFVRLSKVQRTGDDAVLNTDGFIGYLASSERYKENIVNLTIDTAQIYNLTARNFRYKDTTEKIPNEDGTAEVDMVSVGTNSFGYIAEEVNPILPDLVGLDSDNQPNTVNYKLLSVLLLEELKKLKARVTVLEAG